MISTTKSRNMSPALLACLLIVPAALAHNQHSQHGTDDAPNKDVDQNPPTYFAHKERIAWIYAHIILSIVSYILVLPIVVMLYIAKSRFTLPLQAIFLVTNAISVLCAGIYNASTPDLYPNNAHHKIGWIITWLTCCDIAINFIRQPKSKPKTYSLIHDKDKLTERNEGEHQDEIQDLDNVNCSLYRDSVSNSSDDTSSSCTVYHENVEDDEDCASYYATLPLSMTLIAVSARFALSRVWKHVQCVQNAINRILLPFGFITCVTGIATYGRFFEGNNIFNGLAHWIKGGVFIWLGLLTLGRWSGSFADLGWAWNLKQPSQRWTPSAELVESFLIFFYGATNIFLEHLAGWGQAWTSRDLEHLSLTVLFIGGGLLGMLVESKRIRELLNLTVSETYVNAISFEPDEEASCVEPPTTYRFSLNPIPALVILLVGIMMSSHEQQSMISTMIHKQWGDLLKAASFCRGLTYVLLYLRPLKSTLPSRPPTEILAAFGLISGGIIFMASSTDTVQGMIHYQLDAMFIYTVTLGLVGALMAWEIVVLAIKGWAIRRERPVSFCEES